MKKTEHVIEMRDIVTKIGGNVVHNGVNVFINYGEIFAIVGGSGSGKTTLLREILMLQMPSKGTIKVFGKDIRDLEPHAITVMRQRWGVMFQQGALFSSLTVLENVCFPLKEFTHLSSTIQQEIALLKLRLVGLRDEDALKYPAELSGGMVKRVAIARALVMDPEILFLDEPTSGLDPNSSSGIDDLVLDLKAALGLTIVMVTHDLDTLWRVPDRIVFLGEGQALGMGNLKEIMAVQHPIIQQYFCGPRGRAASQVATSHEQPRDGEQ